MPSQLMNLIFLAKKKMERGISHATGNEPLLLAARHVVQQDFQKDTTDSPTGQPTFIIETPLYTFTLPDLTSYPGAVLLFSF